MSSTLGLTNQNRAGRLAPYLYGTLFVLLGLLVMAWFVNAVFSDPVIREAINRFGDDSDQSSTFIMAFLTEFGIILPFLVFGLGLLSLWLGARLFTKDISVARWAQSALMWLTIGVGVAIAFTPLQLLVNAAAARRVNQTVAAADYLADLPLLLIALIFFGAAYYWLNLHIDQAFEGKEYLNSRQIRSAWNLLIPTLAIFVLVAARPLEQTFIRSLTDKRFAGQEVPNFVGTENYRNLLSTRLDVVNCRLDEATNQCDLARDGSIRWQSTDRELLLEGFRTAYTFRIPLTDPPKALAISGLDSDFIKSAGTTLIFTIISVALELLIALFIALTVNSAFKGRGLMRAVMLVPWAIPTVIAARLWELMLKDTSAGIINRVAMDLGLITAPQAWLATASLQLPAAIMVDVWKTSSFMALLLLAGLQTIPKEMYEAASVDGSNKVQQFFAITLPLLRPTIAVALVFRTLDALRVFDLFNVLFGRQQLSMATYNYETLVNNQQDGYASAISMIIFVLISIFAIIYVRILNVETE